MHRVWGLVTNYSLLLILGALTALVWANLDPSGYDRFVSTELITGFPVGLARYDADGQLITRTLTLQFLVNDLLMALFFVLAGKEVWEAVIFKDGALRGRRAATPLIATLGGMLGPVTVYLGLASLLGSDTFDAVARGWAIPTATDIAFSYLVGRIVFGAGHPAVRFLLLLAIADDAAGLIILAVFYPSGALQPGWLLLSAGAAAGVYALCNWLPRWRDLGLHQRPHTTWMRETLSFWPYLIAGAFSWFGFQNAGINPALGLLPIVVTIPHADREIGLFAPAEHQLGDLLNQIARHIKRPVEVILFFFGLLNAGVAFASIGQPTWLVLAGLMVGKPLGIFAFGWVAARIFGLGLPRGMRSADLFVVGCVAAVGFTVSLFIASVAFDQTDMLGDIPVQDAAKMGAVLSFTAAFVAVILGKLTGTVRQTG